MRAGEPTVCQLELRQAPEVFGGREAGSIAYRAIDLLEAGPALRGKGAKGVMQLKMSAKRPLVMVEVVNSKLQKYRVSATVRTRNL